jgi:ubiquinone/menaquinone biosynthesis C-methylase UbiE
VQSPEELYRSRALKFNMNNKDLWLSALQVQDGMKILEVGCGGGIFCNRIKEYLPNTTVTGLDYDSGHIAWAKEKAASLTIDTQFIVGDATALPFEENIFDVCFSHTVINFCEPSLFISEQYRVLKPGGKIVILNSFGGEVSTSPKREMWMPDNNGAECALFEKLWAEASKNQLSQVKKYPISLEDYPTLIGKCGFEKANMEAIAVAAYNPDSFNTTHDMAIEMIEENRLSTLGSVHKARELAPAALTENEFSELVLLINARYDERINKYKAGEKVWDFTAGITLAFSGTKAIF